MKTDLRTYSEQRIGLIWTAADHQYLVESLAKIDQTSQQVWELIRREVQERPKRIDELLDFDEPE